MDGYYWHATPHQYVNAVVKGAGATALLVPALLEGNDIDAILDRVKGQGVEMVITLGTGMGCALYMDGRYVPNLELAHHPFKGKDTYEDYVGARAFAKVGKKKWNKRVKRVIEQIEPIWNPHRLYIGGGNAKHLRIDLPPIVRITDNVAGLLGGIALWNEP